MVAVSAILIIVIAVLAGGLAGTVSACIMTSGATEDAFRAGYSAGKVAQFEDDFRWGGNEGAGDE